MKQIQRDDSNPRALIEKPPLAVVAKGAGHSLAVEHQLEPLREERIREAAYARYQARGCVHGNELDDWLAAEASLTD